MKSKKATSKRLNIISYITYISILTFFVVLPLLIFFISRNYSLHKNEINYQSEKKMNNEYSDKDNPNPVLPVEYIKSQNVLKLHPLRALSEMELKNMSIADIVLYLHHNPVCTNLPIFVSMAAVFNDLYWQLIENFIYTMVKFDLIKCSFMICISGKIFFF